MKVNQDSKPSLLIVYDYFYPGYKAGGPIQSLTNLVIALQNHYSISVITSAYDLHSNTCYDNILINSWNALTLPGTTSPLTIWYAGKNNLNGKKIKELLLRLNPDVVYLNGIFSYRFFILPLLVINKLKHNAKLVVCPRGMLQQGALGGKHLKKRLYLSFLKISGLPKNIHWHATNGKELEDIKKVFGQQQQAGIASNIPRRPLPVFQFPQKQNGKLKLIYLSLIAEKKNLLFLLEIIQHCSDVSLDIYGPVKDNGYWEKCKSIIAQMPGRVTYRGEVLPVKVQEVISEYDAAILLTKGENFGHALYESLSVGRPVITSLYTPWVNLEQQKAGWNITISTIDDGVTLLHSLCDMPSGVFNEYCTGAHNMATEYYARLNSVAEYTKLF